MKRPASTSIRKYPHCRNCHCRVRAGRTYCVDCFRLVRLIVASPIAGGIITWLADHYAERLLQIIWRLIFF